MAGPALWNATTRYPQNPSGDWVKYFAHILGNLGAGECDGLALHTYTHDHDPSRVRLNVAHPSPGYHHLRDEFRSYRDLMEAIPSRFRHLPVYITETDPTERHRGWGSGPNNGWVRAAYEEIADWNSGASHQPIQALVLYRWFKAADQPEWSIVDRPGVQNDLRQAMRSEPAAAYRVRMPSAPIAPAPKPGPVPTEPIPDVVVPPGFSNQQLIDAFYRAGLILMPDRPWGLMSKSGLKLNALAQARKAPYAGPELDDLARLTLDERRLVKWKLAAIWKPAAARGDGPAAPPVTLRHADELEDLPLAPPIELTISPERGSDSDEERIIRTWNQFGWLLMRIADLLAIDPGAAVALAATDLSPRGLDESGRLIIRFENHLFFQLWGERNLDAFHRYFRFDPRYPWLEHRWRPDTSLPWRECHTSLDEEWAVFELACTLDDTTAIQATAMGAPRNPGATLRRNRAYVARSDDERLR